MAKKILSETSKPQPLRLLMVEDSEDDTLLTILALKKGGYDPVYELVEDAGAMRKALLEKSWDVILCDYQMPQFNGPAAIAILKETGIDIPLIIVSGAIGEETAVECMRLGAHDYVMKNNLPRLASAIERELKEADSRLQRKQAEEALRESERKYKLITEKMTDIVWIVDMDLRTVYVTPSVLTVLGFSQGERMLQTINEQLTPDSLSSGLDALARELALEEQGHGDPNRNKTLVLEYYHKDGSTRLMDTIVSMIRNDQGVLTGIHGVSKDITERKHAEEALRKSEEKYRTILENIEDGYFEVDITGNLTFFNDSVCRIIGNTRAELMGMNNRQYTDKENSQILFQAFNKVFVTGKPSQGVDYEIIRKDGTKLYIQSSVSLIRNTSGEPTGFRGIMRNITERKRAEEQLKQTLESLRKAVGTTIQVMVSAVETRDPYTAGHQVRSADIARAIATEMGLSQEKIEGIRMAGSIHDIGKLSIPAEILSKPARLSEIEYSLVKEHSRSGYEILKGVESPWPLAQIVYQHHERMDGSGYPRNLKGDDILMEARIMAVADVVESMASHRPYRPALGINAALEELEKNKETLYDANAVDACLRLFREKGFKIDGNTLAR